MDLNIIWFLLVAALLTVYAILDGFDLGVGILHLMSREAHAKKMNITAIGPVWDGNEVWLLVAGGSLFAAFPIVYATLLSTFYLLFVLLLVSLIFRAVSLEVRNKVSSIKWQSFWDFSFGSGSLSASLLFGIMTGNILQGLSIGQDGNYIGHFLSFFSIYPILVAILITSLFIMQGAIYMTLKVEDALLRRMCRYVIMVWIAFVILYTLVIISTFYISPFLLKGLLKPPVFWFAPLMPLFTSLYIPVAIKRTRYFHAFLASSVTIACTAGLIAISLFPLIVPSSIDPVYNLTIYNSASGPRTLKTLLIIALTVLPFVIGYTVYIHRVFKGKITLSGENHY